MAPHRPVEIPEDQMVLQGQRVDEVVSSLGYAFATSSYSTNGLAVLPAISDLRDLVHIFAAAKGTPDHVYLVGVSEGGLITALSLEQHPQVYDGGLALCGPYGDFRFQINHYGDFRVVFDYFFPNLMAGEPLSVPAEVREDWTGFFTTTIEPAVTDPANITQVNQLLTVTGVSPYKYAPPTSTASISKLLWYNAFATEDATIKLGGQPFDNEGRWYSGSSDDAALNAAVDRFVTDQAALEEIQAHYQTTGRLRAPLVTMHTTGDEGVPYWHATRYLSKTEEASSGDLHQHVRVDRHGHCNFKPREVIIAFGRLAGMVMEHERTYAYLPLISTSSPSLPDPQVEPQPGERFPCPGGCSTGCTGDLSNFRLVDYQLDSWRAGDEVVIQVSGVIRNTAEVGYWTWVSAASYGADGKIVSVPDWPGTMPPPTTMRVPAHGTGDFRIRLEPGPAAEGICIKTACASTTPPP